jgi:hypothetical protein
MNGIYMNGIYMGLFLESRDKKEHNASIEMVTKLYLS